VTKPLVKLTFYLLLGLSSEYGLGQRYIGIDKGGIRKAKIEIGDPFRFKQFGNPVVYNAVFIDLGDTTIYLEPKEKPVALPLSEIEAIFLPKKWPRAVALTSEFAGVWFLIAAFAEAIADTGNYSAGGAAIIGGSLIAAGQIFRLFRWKKYGSGKYRFRILEKY